MKKVVLACAALFTLLTATAQYKNNDNASGPAKAVFFELGGPGLASLNYDMRFTKSESGIGGRIGVGGFSIGTGTERATVVFIPLGINYLLGKDGKNYFEVGGGVTPVIANSNSSTGSDNFTSTFGHLNLGYRLQPADGGFFFRATINPVFGKGFFWPYYGGVSFGYKF
jgi:hypothetical protein